MCHVGDLLTLILVLLKK